MGNEMALNRHVSVNSSRLLSRIKELGQAGRDADGKLSRLAISEADKVGRDILVTWIREAGLEVAIDRIGNIFGIWRTEDQLQEPVLIGSHIDTVKNAGIYDGCYGVLSGLEVIQTLRESGFSPGRPIAVAAFTNEEGVRYAPDMMGSLVYAGEMTVEDALSTVGIDGTVLGDELSRIQYAGTETPGFMKPYAYVELHVEQGPVLERAGAAIGAVEKLQGVSWMRVTIEGTANHAGTTPMTMRQDAGHAAARMMTFLHGQAVSSQTGTVVTVGSLTLEPNVINVIPSRACFTIDLRDPDEQSLQSKEVDVADFLSRLTMEGFSVNIESLARSQPVVFDRTVVQLIEAAADGRGLLHIPMTSGAGHDAQMIARMCPAGMIFVPSVGGISHNPNEYTLEHDLVNGANVLLDVVNRLSAN